MNTNSSRAGLRSTRNLLAGAAVASLLAIASVTSASATPIDLSGYTGQLSIKFNNYESFSDTQTLTAGTHTVVAPANGSDNYGIFFVTSMSPLAMPLTNFLAGSPYSYVGVFNGITTTVASAFTGAGGTGFNADTTGGTFSLYQIPNLTLAEQTALLAEGTGGFTTGGCTVAGAAGGMCYNGITNVSGSENPVLTWDLGTNDLNPVFDTLTGKGAVQNFGSAGAIANLTGGTDVGQFGGIGAPINIGDNFCFQGGGGGLCNFTPTNNFQLYSNDPVILNASTAVPEPASLALFGAGLLGLGFIFRRRQKRSAGLAA